MYAGHIPCDFEEEVGTTVYLSTDSYSSGYIESEFQSIRIPSGYIESEKATRDRVSCSSSTSDNEVALEVRDIIEILALRARTPRTLTNPALRFHVEIHLEFPETSFQTPILRTLSHSQSSEQVL